MCHQPEGQGGHRACRKLLVQLVDFIRNRVPGRQGGIGRADHAQIVEQGISGHLTGEDLAVAVLARAPGEIAEAPADRRAHRVDAAAALEQKGTFLAAKGGQGQIGVGALDPVLLAQEHLELRSVPGFVLGNHAPQGFCRHLRADIAMNMLPFQRRGPRQAAVDAAIAAAAGAGNEGIDLIDQVDEKVDQVEDIVNILADTDIVDLLQRTGRGGQVILQLDRVQGRLRLGIDF